MSWFDQDFLYRVEEGQIDYVPSKIEAVRKDDGDFDDGYLESLKNRLEASIFPRRIYRLFVEVDEFRRFVRIYVDSIQNKKVGKKPEDIQLRIIVPATEIEARLLGTEEKAAKTEHIQPQLTNIIELQPIQSSG